MSERELSAGARAYIARRDGLIAEVHEAIQTERDHVHFAELHCRLLDRIELILVTPSDVKGADGVLVTAPIARRHARAMLADLAEAYGIDVEQWRSTVVRA